jgi:hypothetical protein
LEKEGKETRFGLMSFLAVDMYYNHPSFTTASIFLQHFLGASGRSVWI